MESKYNFSLPNSLIANAPVSPRDSARLFFYDTKSSKIVFDTFRNLDKYLPGNSLLITNDTKVLPVRLLGTKETGGKIEIFLCLNEYSPKGTLRALTNRRLEPDQVVRVGTYTFKVLAREEDTYLLKPDFSLSRLPDILEKIGHTPIPPYLKSTNLSEHKLRKEYQSVLAKYPASVAAPTALLHFTPKLLTSLKKIGVKQKSITLHVGRGTFAPLNQSAFKTNKLHVEPYEISPVVARAIKQHTKSKSPIIAVGTTVTRALESYGKSKKLANNTDIFITPGFDFKIIDGLITNFHLPNSSLMYLVDAFLQHKKAKQTLPELYKIAIKNKFRFYSFGDGMLIL